MAQQRHADDDIQKQKESKHAVKRRGLIAGAAALVASAALLRTSEAVAATDLSSAIFYQARDPYSSPFVMQVDASTLPTVNSANQPYNVMGIYGAGKGDGTGIAGFGGASGDGVAGQAYTGASKGVYGKHFGGGAGVYGESVNGRGIYGTTPNGFGVEGISTNFYGVVGRSTTSIGVFGTITGGSAPGTIAIDGSNLSTGADSHGIVGVATVGHGLVGTTNFTGGGPPYYGGLVGNATHGAYAGLFFGNVSVTGTLNGHTAILQQAQVAVAHPDGSHRLAQAVVSPEGWMEDVGEGSLTNGQADIKIAPDFAALADTGKYHVFLTAHGNFNLHVAEMKAEGFVVRVTDSAGSAPPTGGAPVPGSQVAKASNVVGTFSWKVMAKRKDGQAARLATYTFPKIEPPHIPEPSPSVPPRKP